MHFLHPGMLYWAPLVAVPILIHLLNRLRYRRVRWAAMQFLQLSDRRLVRRAQIKQWLLLALRTLVLAAGLLALAQPVFRGAVAAVLGASSQVAVLVDASASMTAHETTTSLFGVAKREACQAIDHLPRTTRVTAGTVAQGFDTALRGPTLNHAAARAVLAPAAPTAGHGHIPRALTQVARMLPPKSGGAIWLLTDMQAADWRATDAGAWAVAHKALQEAGTPAVLITDLASAATRNFAIVDARLEPAAPVLGESPKLVATVAAHGAGGVATVTLQVDGKRLDARSLSFAGPGRAECVFRLAALQRAVHVGRLSLGPDSMPADNVFPFVVRTRERLPILIVDGAPSATPFAGAGDFLAAAAQPLPGVDRSCSPFAVKRIQSADFAAIELDAYVAVLMADVMEPGPGARARLRHYLERGGLLFVYPGAHTDLPTWTAARVPGLAFHALEEESGAKGLRVPWAAPANPVTATLLQEGLDRLRVRRFVRLETSDADEILATLENGAPFLLRRQVGRGKMYGFAVSAQADFSTLPLSPILPLVLHRAIRSHLTEMGEPLAREAFSELRLHPPAGVHHVRTPDGRACPLAQTASGQIVFADTTVAGVYRLVRGRHSASGPEADKGKVLAAIHVPAVESTLERITPAAASTLLRGVPVQIVPRGERESLENPVGASTSGSGFPLAVLALLCLLGEVLLGYHLDNGGNGKSVDSSTAEN